MTTLQERLDRVRAFKHFRDLNPDKSYTSPEAEDAIAFADEIERLRTTLAYMVQTLAPLAEPDDNRPAEALARCAIKTIERLRARVAEAEALLRECKCDEWENVEEMAAWKDDRDAFLAADSASYRENYSHE